MKRLKNISLVYSLQIFAVIILFFYPDYTSKAGLKNPSVNNEVEKNNGQFSEGAILNSVNQLWLTGDKKITPGNDLKTKAYKTDEQLKKEYHIDALSLNKMSVLNFKLSPNAVSNAYK